MEWFRADLIQEFNFSNGQKSRVWVNQILIRADSLELAYEKSLAHGALYNDTYTNTDGDVVTVRFRGLEDLYLIYDKLEDGAELLYTEYDDLTDDEISKMITPKEMLAAFQAHDPASPDLNPGLYRLGDDNDQHQPTPHPHRL